jgi:Zn-dependent M28 family amino/carboxypeptidase
MLSRTTQEQWSGWITRLSGQEPVLLDGVPTTIATRNSLPTFMGASNARAFDYLTDRLQDLAPDSSQVTIETYPTTYGYTSYTWKNLVYTQPGRTHPEEEVLLVAHFDDRSQSSWINAPGADDNATGVAALLEAARLLRAYTFDRTIRLVWFSGEEQNMRGSQAYVGQHKTADIKAVINLDMIGYDHDNDRCFELHTGSLAGSDRIAKCFVDTIRSCGLRLTSEVLHANASWISDQASFWEKGIPAVWAWENFSDQRQPGGCGVDRNPYYHHITDTLAELNLATGFDISRAGLATLANLAGSPAACFNQAPVLQVKTSSGQAGLSWKALQGAVSYRIYRSLNGCSGDWQRLAQVTALTWNDTRFTPGVSYQIEALASGNTNCVSPPSACRTVPSGVAPLATPNP